jgi:hypothetical protein
MTTLEIILICIIWIALGFFIAYKRDWYENRGGEHVECVLFSVIGSPINFIITIIKIYFIDKWKN